MSTSREELGRLVPGLSEDVAAKVLDFARAQQAREDAEDARVDFDGEALLDRIGSNPEQRAKFNAMIDLELDAVDRGEGVDGAGFFAEMRAKSQRRRER